MARRWNGHALQGDGKTSPRLSGRGAALAGHGRACSVGRVAVANSAESSAPPFLSQQVTAANRFYLNLKPRSRVNLAVVCGGWEECAEDYLIQRSTFPYLSIEFVAAGRGTLTLAGGEHALQPGTVFCYGPSVAHVIRNDAVAPLRKYFVDFAGATAPMLLREAGIRPGTVRVLAAVTEVHREFDRLIAHGQRRDQRTERACALQLELLLHAIARASEPPGAAARRLHETFRRCREHVDQHFLRLDSVDAIATECHVHKSHLCRMFRRFQNESPLQYLQRLKMQWAANRLQSSGALVRQVADELGIDPFQFSRTFKRVHGLSPQNFFRLQRPAGDPPNAGAGAAAVYP